MKIALFGAGGNIGSRIAKEALARGHSVTAIVRHPEKVAIKEKDLRVLKGDATDPAAVATAVKGYDAVISAIAPSPENWQSIVTASHSLIDGLKSAGVKRLLIVGGAGSLEVAPGLQLVDAPDFPAAWKAPALAHRDALNVFRGEKELEWTYVSPAAFIEPGTKTRKFRIGTDQLVTDASGKSAISMEDFAAALLDEVEKPKFIRKRFTVAY